MLLLMYQIGLSMATHVVPFKMVTENCQEIKLCRVTEHCLTFDVSSSVDRTSLRQWFFRYYQKLMNSSVFRFFCLKSSFMDLWLGMFLVVCSCSFFSLTKFYGSLTFSCTYFVFTCHFEVQLVIFAF